MIDKIDIKGYRNILIPRFDTFGDIVLLQGFIKALLDLLPDAKFTLLVRNGYDQLAELFPDRLIWKTIRINPYKGGPDPAKVSLVLKELSGNLYDLVLITTYSRTWLDDLVAAKLTSSWRVGIGESANMPDYLVRILSDLGIETASCSYDEFVSVEERTYETEKYQILWEKLTGDKRSLPPPELSIPKNTDKMAEEVLARLGLTDESYYFCSPAGIANVPFKIWPEDNFAKVIAYIEEKHKLRALVAGHETEKEIIDKVIGLARQKGAHPEPWLGKDGDIPLACALVEKSFFYLGNDTGLMHMAVALKKPVLAIFGGGTWPRFLPQAKIGRAFVLPMPCFYCKWNCIFDEALCVKSLSFDVVLKQLTKIIEEILQGKGDFKVIEEKVDYGQAYMFFEKAVGCLQASEADRAARLEVIHELGEKLQASEVDSAARLGVIEELGEKLQAREADCAVRLEVIKKQETEIIRLQQQLDDLQQQFLVKILRRFRLVSVKNDSI